MYYPDHILTSGWDFAWFGKSFTDEFLKTKIIFCGLYPVIDQSWKDYEYKRFIAVSHILYYESSYQNIFSIKLTGNESRKIEFL